MTWVRVAAMALMFQGAVAPGARPLPDAGPLLEMVRQHLAHSQEVQRQFAYRERRTELKLNPFGRLGTSGSRVYDVVPVGDGLFMRRVLERDGKVIADAPQERFGRRTSRGRAMVDDVASMLDFVIDRREMLDGRPAVVATFKPKPDARPRTREGRIARAFTGTIWIDDESENVARVDATAIDEISIGYGLLAKLNKGSKVTLTQQQIEPEVWLPVSLRFEGEGRALLVRKLTINFALDWFNYRRVYSSSPS